MNTNLKNTLAINIIKNPYLKDSNILSRYNDILGYPEYLAKINLPNANILYPKLLNVTKYTFEKYTFYSSDAPQICDFGQFFAVLISNNIKTIVTLGPIIEDDIIKIDQYWNVTFYYSIQNINITTSCVENKINNFLIIRKINFRSNGLIIYTITQYHAMTWSDFSDTLIKPLDELINNIIPIFNNILVHCSAGFGRTGTFYTMLLCKLYKCHISVAINFLRDKRPAIQSLSQYQMAKLYCSQFYK